MATKPTSFLTYRREDGTTEQIPWTAPAPFVASDHPAPPSVKRCLSPAEEIWQLVQDYSKETGIPIQVEDAKACLAAIAEEKRKTGLPPPPPEPPRTVEEALGPRPMWGDPSFWDYWRKAKTLGFVNEKNKKGKK